MEFHIREAVKLEGNVLTIDMNSLPETSGFSISGVKLDNFTYAEADIDFADIDYKGFLSFSSIAGNQKVTDYMEVPADVKVEVIGLDGKKTQHDLANLVAINDPLTLNEKFEQGFDELLDATNLNKAQLKQNAGELTAEAAKQVEEIKQKFETDANPAKPVASEEALAKAEEAAQAVSSGQSR